MSQDVMICVMNSTIVFDDVHLEMQSSESCEKCFNLDAELLKKQNTSGSRFDTAYPSIRYGISTAYWGFLGVGTTLDIFQNIIFIPYFQFGVLVFWIRRIELYSLVVFGECRHGYAVSSLMDTVYWSSE
ncbi:hypothetical protein Tco_1238223 [Tanacetum coccineum]